jgi:FKBP-type peptidyl-prolyl cis-trans isomerase
MSHNATSMAPTRGQDPVTFPLSDLIQGWQIGIPGMKVGGIRRLTIPYQLAYGERDIPGEDGQVQIPGKSTLVFAIELKGVK